ncbi:MAG TPA: S1C family serine protease [Polyangiaceae bacterium]|nr:S1C family serine protease [Polyangiaceae bacterium]
MTESSSTFSDPWVSVAERAQASLVHVAAPCRRGGTGSVFGEGVILTTARAVAGRERLEVVQGEVEVEATVVGYDAATDLGVARTESPIGQAPVWIDGAVPLGSGLLLGSRPGRATRVRRALVTQVGDSWHSVRGGRIERYVELDARPEPGFSGGLAFDSGGRAVGMASAGLLRDVPLLLEKATLDRIVNALLAHGRVRRGYLGVGTQAVRLPDALRVSAGQGSGLLVASVQPGSAAEQAGLLLGDVLLELGTAQLTGAAALQAALESAEGQLLSLKLLRAGQSLSVDVTPGARP